MQENRRSSRSGSSTSRSSSSSSNSSTGAAVVRGFYIQRQEHAEKPKPPHLPKVYLFGRQQKRHRKDRHLQRGAPSLASCSTRGRRRSKRRSSIRGVDSGLSYRRKACKITHRPQHISNPSFTAAGRERKRRAMRPRKYADDAVPKPPSSSLCCRKMLGQAFDIPHAYSAVRQRRTGRIGWLRWSRIGSSTSLQIEYSLEV